MQASNLNANKIRRLQGYLRDLTHAVLDQLEHLELYVIFADVTSVTFKSKACPQLGTLRISSEPCTPPFIPRWNLMVGNNKEMDSKYKSHWYASESYLHLTQHMTRYANTIMQREQEAETKQLANEGTKPAGIPVDRVPIEAYESPAAQAEVQSLAKVQPINTQVLDEFVAKIRYTDPATLEDTSDIMIIRATSQSDAEESASGIAYELADKGRNKVIAVVPIEHYADDPDYIEHLRAVPSKKIALIGLTEEQARAEYTKHHGDPDANYQDFLHFWSDSSHLGDS